METVFTSPMTKNTCKQCGEETVWADKVCSWCKKEAGATENDLMLSGMPSNHHTLRTVTR